MRPSIKILFGIFSVFVFITSCDVQTENIILADAQQPEIFAKYVSIGGSLVAGYTNGGLYRDGQEASYPNLIAKQAGVSFEQALFPIGQENGTGFLITSAGNSSTQFDKVVDKTGIISTTPLLFSKYSGNLGNYGIVNLRMSDVNKTGLGNVKIQGFNPYFERILPTGKEDLSYIELVKASNFTFFTASIGDYDMLTFAASGGRNSMTETSVFALNCQKLFDALVVNKAQGIVTNLPNILDLPYFNYYSFDEIAKKIGVLGIYITTGNGIIRLATSEDKILLDAISNVGKSNGLGQKKGHLASYPLSNEEVLDKDEINAVAARLNDFNGVLKFEANKRSIPVYDLNNLYKQVKNKSFIVNGIKFDNSLMTGSFFSLDGIHPTPRGSAVIANEIIKVINDNYKNSIKVAIPTLDVSRFEGLKIK
jgi:hypothetical protein